MKFSVCVGSFCHAKGSYNVLCTLRQMVEEYSLHDQVEVASMFCDGDCVEAVKVKIDDRETVSVTGPGFFPPALRRADPGQIGKSDWAVNPSGA